jgi:hypothetical protein
MINNYEIYWHGAWRPIKRIDYFEDRKIHCLWLGDNDVLVSSMIDKLLIRVAK